jgi:NTE family protein
MNPYSSTSTRRGTAVPEVAQPCATPFESIALLLQGGGALGAYQAGVYERLVEAGIEPTWVAGISIGAINSAIIAGNRQADRVARLRRFWEKVSDADDMGASDFWSGLLTGDVMRSWVNQAAASGALARGVPGFFVPRMPPPYLPWAKDGAPSYYDTSPLRATLEELVDFERINSKQMRFSVGAVNVRTGDFAYFDNADDDTGPIGPEHIMASSALPPGFAAVEVDGDYYWDGGLVSNTPLDWVLSARSGLDTLVLQVDLWSADGAVPRDLTAVGVRMKEIQFSSRTRAATKNFRRIAQLRTAFNELLARMPAELAKTPQAKLLAQASDPAVYNIVHLIYQSPNYEGQAKDFEFSRRTMLEHWRAGYEAAAVTLSHPEVLALPAADKNPAVYDFLTSRQQADPSNIQPGNTNVTKRGIDN